MFTNNKSMKTRINIILITCWGKNSKQLLSRLHNRYLGILNVSMEAQIFIFPISQCNRESIPISLWCRSPEFNSSANPFHCLGIMGFQPESKVIRGIFSFDILGSDPLVEKRNTCRRLCFVLLSPATQKCSHWRPRAGGEQHWLELRGTQEVASAGNVWEEIRSPHAQYTLSN